MEIQAAIEIVNRWSSLSAEQVRASDPHEVADVLQGKEAIVEAVLSRRFDLISCDAPAVGPDDKLRKAAPDLLDALQAVLDEHGPLLAKWNYSTNQWDDTEAAIKARVAIAKATGDPVAAE